MKKKTPWYILLRLLFQITYVTALILGILGSSYLLIIILLAIALLTGAFYCGWLCPFGFIQELMGKVGRLFRIPLVKIPRNIEKGLRYLRYILLALSFSGLAFLFFLDSPYRTFTGIISGNTNYITLAAWSIFFFFIALSLIIERPFCRYFCSEGARYGVLSLGRLFSIRRKKKSCISCGKCDKACPTQIQVSTVNHIRNGQCINCFKCIAACPVKGTLDYGWAINKRRNK